MTIKIDQITDTLSKGTDTINSISSGNIAGIVSSPVMDRVFFWLWFLVIAAILIFGFVFIYKYVLTYNKKVLVKQVKGNVVIDNYMTAAKVIKDARGSMKLEILKGKRTCPIPKYSITSKMGKADFYTLYEGEDGELYSWDGTNLKNTDGKLLEFVEEIKNTSGWDPQMARAWRLEEIKNTEAVLKKQGIWDKYGKEITLLFVALAIVGMVWLGVSSLERIYMSNAAAFNAIAQSCMS